MLNVTQNLAEEEAGEQSPSSDLMWPPFARLSRTRFKPSRFASTQRFRQSKTAFSGQLSTPLDVDDTGEPVNLEIRSKTSAATSRSRRQNALNRIVARRRGEADLALRVQDSS